MKLEDKATITIDEFKAFLAGLICGKNGAIPDKDDWVLIKKMLDKVYMEPVYIREQPYQPYYPFYWYSTPGISPSYKPAPYTPNVWCTSGGEPSDVFSSISKTLGTATSTVGLATTISPNATTSYTISGIDNGNNKS